MKFAFCVNLIAVLLTFVNCDLLNNDKALEIVKRLVEHARSDELIKSDNCFVWCAGKVKFDPTGELCTQVCNDEFPPPTTTTTIPPPTTTTTIPPPTTTTTTIPPTKTTTTVATPTSGSQ